MYRGKGVGLRPGSTTLPALDQLVQVIGALLILSAFVAAQLGSMDPHSRAYLSLNLVGSLVLTVLAWHEQQWGFLMLEAVWAAVSLWGLVQVLRGQAPPAGH